MADLSYMWAGKFLDAAITYSTFAAQLSVNLVVGEAAIVVLTTSTARSPVVSAGDLVLAGSNASQTVHIFYTKYATQTTQTINHGGTGVSGSYQVLRINPFGLPPGAVAASNIGVNITAVIGSFDSQNITPAQNNASIFCIKGGNFSGGYSSPSLPVGYQWVVEANSFTNLMQVMVSKQDTAAATGIFAMGEEKPNMQIAFYPVNGTLPSKFLPPMRPNGSSGGTTSITTFQVINDAWTADGSVASGQWDYINEPITLSAANGDTALSTQSGVAINNAYNMDLVPAGLVSIDNLLIRASTVLRNHVDDYVVLYAFVRDSTNSVIYANDNGGYISLSQTAGGGGATPINFGYNIVRPLTLTAEGLAATKADWDSAIVSITYTNTANMGNDGASGLLVDFQLEGTYVSNASAGAMSVTDTRDTLSGIGAATETGLSTTKPANVRAFPVSGTQINMTWDAVAGATGYDIRRDATIIANNVQGLAYSDTAAIADTLYGYYVRAILGPV